MKKTILTLLSAIFCLAIQTQAQDFTVASEKSVHAVVYIRCLYKTQAIYYEDFFNNDFFSYMLPRNFYYQLNPRQPYVRRHQYMTAGSGVILTEDGYIVTNNHVVANADSIIVTLNDRREFGASIIGTDADNDLAVIKIDAHNLKNIEFGNSDDVKVGQWVLAVGNPFNLTSTVTAGIVSAKARNANILSSKESSQTLTSFIQTDAVMNPGNSGGALVDITGKLIGVNAAIVSTAGVYAGYSFAIPVNIVKKVVNDLIKYGATQIASAGINTIEISSELTNEKHLKDNHGIYIQNVLKNAPGDKAGLNEGDIILAINGKSVNTASEMNEIMTQLSPKEKVSFEIDRNGTVSTKQLTLISRQEAEDLELKQLGPEVYSMGAYLRLLTEREKRACDLSNGLVITKIGRGPLYERGIREGFIITAINNQRNFTLKDVENLNGKKGQLLIEGFYPSVGLLCYVLITL